MAVTSVRCHVPGSSPVALSAVPPWAAPCHLPTSEGRAGRLPRGQVRRRPQAGETPPERVPGERRERGRTVSCSLVPAGRWVTVEGGGASVACRFGFVWSVAQLNVVCFNVNLLVNGQV